MARRTRKNPALPAAPPRRRPVGTPPRQLQSSLDRVRSFAREYERTERPFDPTRAPSWRGSSRDLVVNGGMKNWDEVNPRPIAGYAMVYDNPKAKNVFERWSEVMVTEGDIRGAKYLGTEMVNGDHMHAFRAADGRKFAQLSHMTANGMGMDEFTRGFLETALWSSNDESDDSGGEPLDKNYSIDDFDPKTIAALSAECARFQEENADDLAVAYEAGIRGSEGDDEFSAGHDFWLTRCGHGAGFWDGDYPEPQATRLTESSEKFGNVDLYVGDDGLIYAMGYESGARHGYRSNMEQTHFPFGSKRAGKLDIQMHEFDWEQVDGDVNLPQHGGVIGRCDGSTIDLVEIQPVREYVGDNEAQEVGFPFWTKEASYDLSDLDPSNKEVKAALQSSDVDLDDIDPEHRALAIALACMRYGHGSEEGDGGWAGDKRPGEEGRGNLLGSRKVRWGYAGKQRKTFAEEASGDDDDFRREVLGEEDEED